MDFTEQCATIRSFWSLAVRVYPRDTRGWTVGIDLADLGRFPVLYLKKECGAQFKARADSLGAVPHITGTSWREVGFYRFKDEASAKAFRKFVIDELPRCVTMTYWD